MRGRGKYALIGMIHQSNALARKLLKVRVEERSVHAKRPDNSLGEIRVMDFIAERVLMSKLQLVTNALVKSAIRLLLSKGGDAAVLASSRSRETVRRLHRNHKQIQ